MEGWRDGVMEWLDIGGRFLDVVFTRVALRDAKPCGRVLVPPRSAKNMSWEDCVVLKPPAAEITK